LPLFGRLLTAVSARGVLCTFGVKSSEKAATMSRVFCTFFPQKVLIAVCDWCSLPLFGRQKAAQKPTRRQKRLKDAA